jgi:hypothetical protein
MSGPELQLEKQRAELLKRIGSVGDLRRGSITATSGKCGKPPATVPNREVPGMDRISG